MRCLVGSMYRSRLSSTARAAATSSTQLYHCGHSTLRSIKPCLYPRQCRSESVGLSHSSSTSCVPSKPKANHDVSKPKEPSGGDDPSRREPRYDSGYSSRFAQDVTSRMSGLNIGGPSRRRYGPTSEELWRARQVLNSLVKSRVIATHYLTHPPSAWMQMPRPTGGRRRQQPPPPPPRKYKYMCDCGSGFNHGGDIDDHLDRHRRHREVRLK